MFYEVTETRRFAALEPVTMLALGGARYGGRPAGYAVTVKLEDGSTARFDRLDGEERWHLAANTGPTGVPIREHGDGSRCTIPRHPCAELAAGLDHAAAGYAQRLAALRRTARAQVIAGGELDPRD